MKKRLTSAILAFTVAGSVVLTGCSPLDQAGGGDDSGKIETTELTKLLPAKIRDAGVIHVGVDPSYYPNSFYPEGTEELSGSDIELITAVAKKLGIGLQFTTSNFPGLIAGVASGKFDISMSVVTDTAEREKQVSFVDYMSTYKMVLVPAANEHKVSGDPLTLCGLPTAVPSGTTIQLAVDDIDKVCEAAGKPKVEVLSVDGFDKALPALNSGRAAFILADALQGPGFDENQPGKYVYWRLDGTPTLYCGVLTQIEAKELQDALIAGLKEVHADGTYKAIFKKFKQENFMLDEPMLNKQTS